MSASEAKLVIERSIAPTELDPADQVNGTEPLLEPGPAIELLQSEASLTAEQISAARDAIAGMPESERAGLYQLLAERATAVFELRAADLRAATRRVSAEDFRTTHDVCGTRTAARPRWHLVVAECEPATHQGSL